MYPDKMPDIEKSYSYLSADDTKIFRIIEEINKYYKMMTDLWKMEYFGIKTW